MTECKEGWYGVNCKQQCERHCRDGATCNQVTGHCDRGCEAGWTGDMCDKGFTRIFNITLYILLLFLCVYKLCHIKFEAITIYTSILGLALQGRFHV